MADNVAITPGSGAVVAADDIGGVLYQRVKPVVGGDGEAADVSVANPLPAVAPRTDDLILLLMRVVKLLESNAVVDQQQRQRITLDAIAGALTLATVTNVTNLGTLTTVTGVTTVNTVTALNNVVANAGMDREQYINVSRQTAALTQRPNLIFG
jgi:hypothetical protein